MRSAPSVRGPRRLSWSGDSWERDIEGALDAGLSAIWISHGLRAPREHPRIRVAEGAARRAFLLIGRRSSERAKMAAWI